MVKREETDKSNDGFHYFTIVNPYPLNANMQLVGDRMLFAQWLAAVTGNKEYLMAFYHKPSTPRSVIIQVSDRFTVDQHRRILGKHVWGGPDGFLNEPPLGITEANWSAIYYCYYVSNAGPSEHGWKIVDFDDGWFGTRATSSKKSKAPPKPKIPPELLVKFKKPYPETSWVQAPEGDAISVHLCRNLPTALFGPVTQPPTVASVAPVGSSTWSALKTTKVVPNFATVAGGNSSRAQEDPSPTEEESEPEDEPAEDGEPSNLWAASSKDSEVLISDLAQMSFNGRNSKEICPYHGTTCKKMCEWRVRRERERGPRVGGPSNTKNYRTENQKDRRAPSSGTNLESASTSTPRSPTVASPTSSSPSVSSPPSSVISPVRSTAKTRPGNAWGRGAAPIIRTSGSTVNSPTQVSPAGGPPGLNPPSVAPQPSHNPTAFINATAQNVSSPEAVGRGAPPVRGAPVWASRGRGRGRGGQ